MKKLLSIVLVTAMMFRTLLATNSSNTFAKSNEGSDLNFSVVKDTKEHKIFKFNDETLENYNKNGEEYFIADTKEKKYKIFKENEIVSVVDLETNKVIKTYDVNEIRSNADYESKSISDNDKLSRFSKVSDPGVGTNAVVTDPGTGSSYKFIRTRYMSIDVAGVGVTTAAGIIASVIGGPITGVITTVASGAVSLALPKVYWKESRYEYTSGVYRYTKWRNVFYKYHDYSGYLGTEYTYVKSRIGI